MTAAEIVAAVVRCGFKVIVAPDGPFLHRVEAVAHLPADLLGELKSHRDDVLAYLATKQGDGLWCEVCDRTWFCSTAEVRDCVQSPHFCDRPTKWVHVRDGDGNDRGVPPCPFKGKAAPAPDPLEDVMPADQPPKAGAPSIDDAKALAYKLRRKGVIVIAFGDDGYAAASYGMTRAECRRYAAVLEQIGDMLANGTIEVPA